MKTSGLTADPGRGPESGASDADKAALEEGSLKANYTQRPIVSARNFGRRSKWPESKQSINRFS